MDNKKFMDIKKFIKEEKPSGPRLQSLRVPRDLSLGGTKPKKHFVPNLNVVRNKDKANKEVSGNNEHKRRVRNSDNKQRSTDDRYIQSSGVFSEGVGGDVKRSYRGGDRRGNTKENEYAAATMALPTIKKNLWEVNKKNEENIFEEIMGNDEESDDEKLPFRFISWNENDLKKVPMKSEIKTDDIKKETHEDSLVDPAFKRLNLETSPFHMLTNEYQNGDTLSDHNPTLTLWSLPDSFAGKGLSEDPNCKKLHDYRLDDMLEGQIGKLVIRKSGRVEVHIGRIKYDLEATGNDGCTEDVVTLEAKEPQVSTATVLGQIQNRYLLSPNWESLLH